MLWAVPLLPLAGAGLAVALRRHPAGVTAATLAALLATLAAAVWAAAAAPAAGWSWGPVLALRLAADGFARVAVVLVPAVALPIVVYAAATEPEGRTRLLAGLTAFVGAMQLVVLAADLLALLVGWELIGAVSWALIAHHWRQPDNPRSAAQAFVATRAGDLGLYVAAGASFAGTGSLAFADLAGLNLPLAGVVAGGVLVASVAKSAQVPFAPWLFSAMAGPTPVSALLHSATLVAAGAYLLVRLAPHFGAVAWFSPAVAGIGLATALAGGVVACVQSQAKQVLAASTSAQYGLVFVAIGTGFPAAAGAHLVTHALFKSLLFLVAGVAIHAVASDELARMRLGSALPRMAALSAVGVLALAAVPPLGAAWSKELIVGAAATSSGWLAAGVLAAGLLSAAYAGRFWLLAYGPGGGQPPTARARPGRGALTGLGAVAAASLALSALWLPDVERAVDPALPGPLPHTAPWELAVGVTTVVAAFAGALVLWRRGALVGVGLPSGVRAAVGDWLGLPRLARVLAVTPVLALAAVLARVDDRVVGAAVRAAARVAGWVSRLAAARGEWTVDGAVRVVAAAALRAAGGSRLADDRGVHAAVEAGAHGVGVAGTHSRRLQTGQSHHYYLILAAGLAVCALVLVGLGHG